MNYFEVLEIPRSFFPDEALMRKKFLELSRSYHPDFFVKKSEEEQEKALQMSALLNKAYRTLGKKDERIGYLLRLEGVIGEEEKMGADPAFLMEMMEVNEELEEIGRGDDAAVAAMGKKLDDLETEYYEPVETIMATYRPGVDSPEKLLPVKAYYFRKKYLDRLREQLAGKS